MEEQGEVAADYLLACLATNPDGDDFVHSGFEAGRALASWLKHVAGIPEAAGVIQQVVRRLEQMYRASDVKSRNRIETGALEHALEDPRLRHFFEHWAGDPVLADAFNAALEWGIAHEDRAV